MRDFTLNKYELLLKVIRRNGYTILPFVDFIEGNRPEKVVILRHDVDNKPKQSLEKARIEYDAGIRSTYYFRIVEESNDPEVIEKIASLGHEIGYHYEDLSLANGEFDKAIDLFAKHLQYFRKFYPVKTICMHGSPASVWDNRLIWRNYNYRDFGVIAEPYFDIDFSHTLYLTDTGRRWNGSAVSVRDKIKNSFQSQYNFRTTQQVLEAFDSGKTPYVIMMTTHPQRWDNNLAPWMSEFVLQNIKNAIKKYLYITPPMTD
ncbi:MAG: hypothetical protein RLZZ630_2020 [Bacteroidota bacterium]|jgi:hypothetical protein